MAAHGTSIVGYETFPQYPGRVCARRPHITKNHCFILVLAKAASGNWVDKQ
jgi:hypothetical protein